MAFEPISWAIGFGLSTASKAGIDFVRGGDLDARLREAVSVWAKCLPKDQWLAPEALFGSVPGDRELKDRPKLAQLRAAFNTHHVPDERDWQGALLEQWRTVARASEVQPFFKLTEDLASAHIAVLASRLRSVCVQDEVSFRATVIEQLQSMARQETQNDVKQMSSDFDDIVANLLHGLERLSLLVMDGAQATEEGQQLKRELNSTAWSMRAKADQLSVKSRLNGFPDLAKAVEEIYDGFVSILKARGGAVGPLQARIANFRSELAKLPR